MAVVISIWPSQCRRDALLVIGLERIWDCFLSTDIHINLLNKKMFPSRGPAKWIVNRTSARSLIGDKMGYIKVRSLSTAAASHPSALAGGLSTFCWRPLIDMSYTTSSTFLTSYFKPSYLFLRLSFLRFRRRNPESNSFRKAAIFRGREKSPAVTLFTARRLWN